MTKTIKLACLLLLLTLCACGGSSMRYASTADKGMSEMDSEDDMPAPASPDFDDAELAGGLAMGVRGPAVKKPRMAQNRAGRADMNDSAAAPPAPPPRPSPTRPSPVATDASPPMTNNKPSTVTKQAVPLLIYSANLNMAVFEANSSINAVQKLAVDSGGYLVRRTDRSITVRVPAKKFRESIAAIDKLGDVLHREESVEDVTDQFYDMRARLSNARALRLRMQQLLAQAKDVKEALAVERELARVTGEIERMEGRLKRLRELIAFSTITIQFRPRAVERVNSKVKLPFPWLNRLGLSNLLKL